MDPNSKYRGNAASDGCRRSFSDSTASASPNRQSILNAGSFHNTPLSCSAEQKTGYLIDHLGIGFERRKPMREADRNENLAPFLRVENDTHMLAESGRAASAHRRTYGLTGHRSPPRNMTSRERVALVDQNAT